MIFNLFDQSRLMAAQEGKGIRIRLHLDDPGLAALPWEFAFDPGKNDYVCLSRKTPIVRHLNLKAERMHLELSPPLRILCMAASPNDRDPLDIKREKDKIEKAVKTLRERGLVQVEWPEGQTREDLRKMMLKGQWHIFHFIGHGGFDMAKQEGVIALVREDGSTDPLPAFQLVRLLADNPPRLIILNCCEGARSSNDDLFSSISSLLIQRGIPAVVAMQFEISDSAAIEFARTFYESLAEGLPVDTSMAEARKAISLASDQTLEWGTPVLNMRSPDGVLFSISRSSVKATHATGTRFCTECGNPLLPGDTTCGRCHPAGSAGSVTIPTVQEPLPPGSVISESLVKVITKEVDQKKDYPLIFTVLGVICSIGAVFMLIFDSMNIFASGAYTPLFLAFAFSGLLLLACGISLLIKRPDTAHSLLIMNFLVAGFTFFLLMTSEVGGFFPNILLWFVMFIIPGFFVAAIFYPFKIKYHY